MDFKAILVAIAEVIRKFADFLMAIFNIKFNKTEVAD